MFSRTQSNTTDALLLERNLIHICLISVQLLCMAALCASKLIKSLSDTGIGVWSHFCLLKHLNRDAKPQSISLLLVLLKRSYITCQKKTALFSTSGTILFKTVWTRLSITMIDLTPL